MGDEQKVLDGRMYEVVSLYNKVNNQNEIMTCDILEAFKLTKDILYYYYNISSGSIRDYEERVSNKITFNDFIKSFIIDKNNIKNKELPLWSVGTEIVLRDLNRLVNKVIYTSNEQVSFTPYLFLGKTYTRVDNSKSECFVFEETRKYESFNLRESYNAILKNMGLKKYVELLLIISSLGYTETPSEILVKFNNNVKN